MFGPFVPIRMSQPSVTKAFATSIVPILTAHGFSRDGAKQLRRMSGDLCQCVFLHVESRTRREFMLEYCTFLTVVPHSFYPLDHGGRFPVGSRGTWYRADSDERLVNSISTVTGHIPPLIEWFRSTGSIEGYISTYLTRQETQPVAFTCNGHSSFNLGCAYLLAGDRTQALKFIARARDEFENILCEAPVTREWADPCIERCRKLVNHIQANTHQSLFQDWRRITYSLLKVPG